MAPNLDRISSLLNLINEAARTLEAGYTTGDGYVPSLDETKAYPLDKQISAPEMKEAVQVLEGACAQLCATLARPNHTVVNALEPSCLRAALIFKIPDILQDQPAGMHVVDIGQRCGVDPSKLARILRLLCAKHCFREVHKDIFANNRLSVQLLASNPLHSLGLHMTGDTTAGATKLAETLADPYWGPSSVPVHSAWNKFTGQPMAMFDYWAQVSQNPDMHAHGERFGIGMIGWGTAVEAAVVVHAYPWNELGPGATVCDLGGGVGAMAIQLARAHPGLQLKLQDLPDRMVQAEKVVWPAECPEAMEQNRIEFRQIDFFIEPPIAGCDVYYLKNILHAFPTSQCLAILKGIRKSMKPGSRVLIHEYILQTADGSDQPADRQLTKAPSPLLSNYGEGRIRQYYLDVSLMVLVNSQERTLDEYIELGEKAGLRFMKVWEFGDMSGVEMCANEVYPVAARTK
ncbi:S-adenosyl-L-methionine-dependent methyltransferase [Mycena maculata]|uniref:S-adenosyl-L-methionine-dependent methyltransferase n=1 Tax=Mycena maculata TaxID=230809 RepID=A0AAD7J230_9AGAR|nr:S-adenosyl-L-methionine-dependent methyltransferase [Mycena maculata]